MTLNEIAALVAGKFNDPLNHMLKQRIKLAAITYRALFLRRDIERNLIDPQYLQFFIVPLMKVDDIDFCDLASDCYVLRSVEKIPRAVRIKGQRPYKFIGTARRTKVFGYTDWEAFKYRVHNEFTADAIMFTIRNGFLYVFNNKLLKHAGIESPFTDPKAINKCATADTCFTDDDDFPIPEDMIPDLINNLTQNEIKLAQNDRKEINIGEDKVD